MNTIATIAKSLNIQSLSMITKFTQISSTITGIDNQLLFKLLDESIYKNDRHDELLSNRKSLVDYLRYLYSFSNSSSIQYNSYRLIATINNLCNNKCIVITDDDTNVSNLIYLIIAYKCNLLNNSTFDNMKLNHMRNYIIYNTGLSNLLNIICELPIIYEYHAYLTNELGVGICEYICNKLESVNMTELRFLFNNLSELCGFDSDYYYDISNMSIHRLLYITTK